MDTHVSWTVDLNWMTSLADNFPSWLWSKDFAKESAFARG